MKQRRMQEKMELQLHEQYAINNNSGLTSVVTILVGMFASFGGWAYVLINLKCLVQANHGSDCCSTSYSLKQFILATDGLFVVFAIMFYICLHQGFAQRKEQFITYAIRRKYYGASLSMIFPKSYHPFGKKGLKIIQGMYEKILRIILCLVSFVVFVCFCIIFYICNTCKSCNGINALEDEFCLIRFSVVFCVLLFNVLNVSYYRLKCEYNKREEEFKNIRPKELRLTITHNACDLFCCLIFIIVSSILGLILLAFINSCAMVSLLVVSMAIIYLGNMFLLFSV